LEKHLEGRTEVEVVDLYLRVKDIMKQKPVTMPSELRKKYEQLEQQIFKFLPKDLRDSIVANNGEIKKDVK